MRNIVRRKEKPQSLDSPDGVNSRAPPLLIYTKRWPVGGTRDWAIIQPEWTKEWSRARPKVNFTQPFSEVNGSTFNN